MTRSLFIFFTQLLDYILLDDTYNSKTKDLFYSIHMSNLYNILNEEFHFRFDLFNYSFVFKTKCKINPIYFLSLFV